MKPDPAVASESESDSSSSSSAAAAAVAAVAPELDFFFPFLPEKRDGNGWLTERVWRGRDRWSGFRWWVSSSDELDWRWWFCMLSQMSISGTREVLLYRPCAAACAGA
jgi:hypothetical protein